MKTKLLHSLVAIALVASCTTEQVPYLNTSSPTTIDVDSNGGRQSISFDTNNDWTARASDSWIQVSPSQGSSGSVSVSVTISENPTFDDRSGYVTVESSGQSARFDIKQSTKHGYQISETNFSVGSNGGSIRVPVQTNVDYTVSVDDKCKSWLSITQTKALSSGEIVIKAEKNSTYDEREGKIYVNYDSNKTTISVKQSGLEELIVNTTSFTIGNNGGDINVPISTNVDYSCNVLGNATSWITVKNLKTKGIEDYKLVLAISKNESMDSRVGQVKVSGAGKESTITINQDATLGLTIQTTSYTVESEGGNVSVSVSSNTNVSYTINNNWIHFVSTKSTTTSTYTFSIDNNPATSSRQGSIKFSAGGQSVTVTINQKENDTITITISSAGTLSSLLSSYGAYSAKKMKLIGPMNSDDFTALCKCTELTYLDMSEVSVKSMYKSPSNLTTIVLPNVLKELGEAFVDHTSLKSVVIPASVQTITGSFKGCSSLETVTFASGSSLTSINRGTVQGKDYRYDYGAFEECTALKSIIIPSQVTLIDRLSFKKCTSLESVTFASNSKLTRIDGYGYKGTSNSSDYYEISRTQGAFTGCSALKSIVFPKSLEYIGRCAFASCTSLVSVDFESGSNLTTIEGKELWGAFEHCSKLERFKIPAKLTKISASMFSYCKALKEVTFENGSQLQSVEYEAFENCESLKTIRFPDSVTSIGKHVFWYSGIESIIIPAGVVSLGNGAFSCANSLKKVSFASGSQFTTFERKQDRSNTIYGDILWQTFWSCRSLTTVDASNCTKMRSVGSDTFADCEITLMIIGTVEPPSTSKSAFKSDVTQYTKLVVPNGSVDKYKAAAGWKDYFDEIVSFSDYYN